MRIKEKFSTMCFSFDDLLMVMGKQKSTPHEKVMYTEFQQAVLCLFGNNTFSTFQIKAVFRDNSAN